MDLDLPASLTINGVRYLREDTVPRESTSPRLEPSYTVSQICEMTGWSKSTIHAAIRRHELRAVAPNDGVRYRRIKESDFLTWQDSKMRGTSR